MSTAPRKRRQYKSGSLFQRKDGMWVGRFEADRGADGARRPITVYSASEQGCKEKLEAKKIDVARNGLPEKGALRNMTVEQWSVEWLKIIVNELRPKSYRASASAVKVWIVPTIGRKRLSTLTPADVRSVFDAMRKAGRSQETRIRVHSDLMQMLKAAKLEGHDVPERTYLVKKPKPGENDREAIPVDAAMSILSVVSTRLDASLWAALLLQGLRQAERLGLTWECVDFERDMIDISWQLQSLPYIDNADKSLGFRVPDGYRAEHLVRAVHLVRPKTKKGQRSIPMVPWMRNALLAWKEVAPANDYDLVWPTPEGKPRSPELDRAEWKVIQELADVAHPTGRRFLLHEARHGTATTLLELGVDKDTVTAIIGHSKFVDAYDHRNHNDSARAALEQLADRLALN